MFCGLVLRADRARAQRKRAPKGRPEWNMEMLSHTGLGQGPERLGRCLKLRTTIRDLR